MDSDGVLVTGGAKRIGREIVRRFANAGWTTAVHYHTGEDEAQSLAQELNAAGARIVAVGGDLSTEQGVRDVLSGALRAVPGLRCVVNNAALFDYDTPQTFSPAKLLDHLAVNAVAPMVFARELFARAKENDRFVMINVLDQKLFNPNPDFFSYTLSKAVVLAATPLLGLALAPRVRVANVAPGLTLLSADQTAENFDRVHSRTPMSAGTMPAEVADAIFFIATNPAMHGSSLIVDHGQHLVMSPRDVMFL